MARKVFVSSDMSNDEDLVDVAEQSPQAALIWPWLLTAFDDWGRAIAAPKRLKASVFPMFDNVTAELVEESLALFSKAGLIQLYEVDGKPYMCIETAKWYKYQTHMNRTNRRPGKDKLHSDFPPPPETPTYPHGEPRGTTGDSGAPRVPVPSPSPSPSPLNSSTTTKGTDSESFYETYRKVFQRDLTTYQLQQLMAYIDQEGFEESVLIRAIETSGMKGGGIGLVLKIMNDYAANGAKTLLGAKEYDAQFESKKQGNRNRGSRGGSPKPNLTVVRSDGPAPTLSREESARMRELARKLKEEKTRPRTDEEMPDPF